MSSKSLSLFPTQPFLDPTQKSGLQRGEVARVTPPPRGLSLSETCAHWREAREVKFDPATGELHAKGESYAFNELLDLVDVEFANWGLPFSRAKVEAEFRVWQRTARQQFLEDLRSSVAFDPSAAASGALALKEVARLLLGPEAEGAGSLVLKAVVQQVIWNTKRKLAGKLAEHHIFFVLAGAPGIGKSTLLRKLTDPLAALRQDVPDLTFIEQENRRSILTKTSLIVADELGRLKKTNVEILKNLITNPNVSFSKHYVDGVQQAFNRATWLGSTNDLSEELLADAALARRFFVVDTHPSLRGQQVAVESLDVLALWKSVDENGRPPIEPFLEQLREVQAGYRTRSVVEIWVAERCEDAPDATQAKNLHEDFKRWCEETSQRYPASIQDFGKLLRAAGFTPKKRGNKSFYNLKLKKFEI